MPNLWGGVGGHEGCAVEKTPPTWFDGHSTIWHTHEATGNFRRGCPLEIHVRRTYRGEASASHAVSPLARRLNESDVGAEKGDEDARESDRVGVAGEECFHVGFSVRAT